MPQKDYKIIMEENKRRREELQSKTHIKAVKDRKRVEMEYLDAIKRQIGYWKGQIDITDSEKDERRYNELKKNIESEKIHLKQIEDELNRINEEIKLLQR